MPGKVLRILDKNTYTYSSAQLGNGANISFPIALNIDISQYPYQELVLRLHSVTWAAGASFKLDAYNSSVSEDDPSLVFRGATSLVNVTVSQAGGDVAPALKVTAATAGAAGPSFDIIATVTQATVATTITFVVSADLVLKS